MLTINDWDSLTNFKETQERKFIRQAQTKSVSAAIVITLLAIFTIVTEHTTDYYLVISLIILNLIQNGFAFGSKSISTINNAYYALMYAYMGLFWYNVHTVTQGNMISLIYFAALIAIFHRDLEASNKIKLIVFSVYCMALLISIPIEVTPKFHLSIWIVFIAGYSYSNIDANRRIMSLENQQASYAVFQRHRRLLEHQTVNSLTRINYHALMLKELHGNSPQSMDYIGEIEKEINEIDGYVKNTEAEDLKSFQV